MIRRWGRATSQFGSRAIRTGDGATAATARHLVVTGPGSVDDYSLWRFSEEQFTELVAALDRRPIDRVVRRASVVGIGSLTVLFVLAIVVLDLIAADDPTFPGLAALAVAIVVVRQRATLAPLPRAVHVSPSSVRISASGGERDVPLGSLAHIASRRRATRWAGGCSSSCHPTGRARSGCRSAARA